MPVDFPKISDETYMSLYAADRHEVAQLLNYWTPQNWEFLSLQVSQTANRGYDLFLKKQAMFRVKVY